MTEITAYPERAQPALAKFSNWLIILQMACVGLVFVPLAQIGGTRIELANAAALVLVASLGLYGLPVLIVPRLMRLIFIALFWLALIFLVRGAGFALIPMTVLACLGALGLMNLPRPARSDWAVIIPIAFVVYGAIVAMAASLAGQNLAAGVIDYLTTLNRSQFVYGVIRPMFNAFVTGPTTEYSASAINALAGGFAIIFVAGLATTGQGRAVSATTLLAGLFCFILFSTSSVLGAGFALVLATARWIRLSQRKIGPIFAVLCAVLLLPYVIGDLQLYVAVNVSGDDTSRAARLGQYTAALDLISESPVLGEGYVEIGGHDIHNWLLFSGVSGGLGLFLLVLAIFVIAAIQCARASVLAIWSDDPAWIAVAGLTFFFLVRIGFGGGGGMPSSLAAVSLALAYLFVPAGGWPRVKR